MRFENLFLNGNSVTDLLKKIQNWANDTVEKLNMTEAEREAGSKEVDYKSIESDVQETATTAAASAVNSLSDKFVKTEYLEANYVDANYVDANYLKATMANIDVAHINTAKVDEMLVGIGMIKNVVADEGHVTKYLDAVQVDATNITAGTIVADRIVVKDGDEYVLLTLNDDGEAVGTKLNGNILEENTVNADRIVANSITTTQLATSLVVGSHGLIDFSNGKIELSGDDSESLFLFDGANGNLVINTKDFTIDADGNAVFGGDMSAASGVFGNNNTDNNSYTLIAGEAKLGYESDSEEYTMQTFNKGNIDFSTKLYIVGITDKLENTGIIVNGKGEDVSSNIILKSKNNISGTSEESTAYITNYISRGNNVRQPILQIGIDKLGNANGLVVFDESTNVNVGKDMRISGDLTVYGDTTLRNLPYITGTKSGTLFSGNPSGGISVSNGLITDVSMKTWTGIYRMPKASSTSTSRTAMWYEEGLLIAIGSEPDDYVYFYILSDSADSDGRYYVKRLGINAPASYVRSDYGVTQSLILKNVNGWFYCKIMTVNGKQYFVYDNSYNDIDKAFSYTGIDGAKTDNGYYKCTNGKVTFSENLTKWYSSAYGKYVDISGGKVKKWY